MSMTRRRAQPSPGGENRNRNERIYAAQWPRTEGTATKKVEKAAPAYSARGKRRRADRTTVPAAEQKAARVEDEDDDDDDDGANWLGRVAYRYRLPIG